MSLESINILAVIVAAVLYMIVGALWYSPLLFGNLWIRLLGKTSEEIGANTSPTIYLFPMVGAVVAALVLSLISHALGVKTLVDGAALGGLVWLAFVATSTLTYTVFEGPPQSVWLLYNGYQLVAYVLMGALLGAWV